MDIHISWEYFLGLVGLLILIAWRTSSRFTALETSMTWVKETLNELKVSFDNSNHPAFESKSPVNLNQTGQTWLVQSGLKEYLDTNKNELFKLFDEKRTSNPYEVQIYVFKYFDTMNFKDNFEDTLKRFAFDKGITMGTIRRIGAIYFRNLCLEHLGMNREDIDKHDPARRIRKKS